MSRFYSRLPRSQLYYILFVPLFLSIPLTHAMGIHRPLALSSDTKDTLSSSLCDKKPESSTPCKPPVFPHPYTPVPDDATSTDNAKKENECKESDNIKIQKVWAVTINNTINTVAIVVVIYLLCRH